MNLYKQQLLKMDKLLATPNMMRLAAEDVPTIEYYGYSRQNKSERYKRGMYLRCLVQNGILKVAFFASQHMRMGGKLPVYELYIDKSKKQFLTLDCQNNKWRTATLTNLIWYSSASYFQSGEKWISREGKKVLREYFGTEQGDYHTIVQFQNGVREEELKRRHKKETDPWDEDLSQTPSLPKDWDRWVRKIGIPEHYMFYQYTRKKRKTGYCTHCEKKVPIRNPKYNADGTCPRCRHKVIYKAVGKAGTVVTKRYFMYLLQRCKDGMMIRMFEGTCKYRKGAYEKPECWNHECRRVICDSSGKLLRAYYWGDYKHSECRWIASSVISASYHSWNDYSGMIYGKTISGLEKRELKTTGLPQIIRAGMREDPELYLAMYLRYPEIEKMVKAGLFRLKKEYLYGKQHYDNRKLTIAANESSLTKMLGVDSQELKRLRSANGGVEMLQWLQYEKISGKEIPDYIINWFCMERIQPKDLQFIRKKMSAVSIYNYIRRQMMDTGMKISEVLTTWSDYLSMAKRFGMDTDDEIIFRVRKLRQRHDELVQRSRNKELAIRAGEILEKYPHVEEIFSSIKEKYEFSDEEYTVIVPSCIEDMLHEGDNLHHCVANSDRYFDRINRQEAYILFLRKTSSPDQSFYTLEIEPGGTIRQKRTMYDRQEKDIEAATPFLLKWQAVVSKRLTEADKKLAKYSKVLRNQEFAQLRNDNVIIHTGVLAGEKLVDVLVKDLMETAA